MKHLKIERSLTSSENVVLTIVNRRPGATLLNCDETTSIEVRIADLITCNDCSEETVAILASDLGLRVHEGDRIDDYVTVLERPTLAMGTFQGL